MRIDLLMEISEVLRHNFFADIAARLPPEYSVAQPADTSKDAQIEALKLEIKILERERGILSDIISRGVQNPSKK